MKASSLKDLGSMRDALQRRARASAERQARLRAEREAVERARHAFALAVGPVTPLAERDVIEPQPAHTPPWPRQRELDEQAALREAWSDEVDVESLLLTDDGLSFRRPGVGNDVVVKLRRGHWSIQAQIDLHGLRRDPARDALAAFVRHATRSGHRCVRVVHGKGLGSPGREPVLKGRAQRWLAQCDDVVAFAQASGPQGGAGALIVLLAGSARARRQSNSAPTPAKTG